MDERFLNQFCRAKTVDTGKWVYGFFVRLDNHYDKFSNRIYVGYAEVDCGDFYPDWYEVDPETLGRRSGYVTEDGKSLYEGDLVLIDDEDDQEYDYLFVLSFGPCGGVKNVDHPVGYNGFFFEPANKYTISCKKCGLRDDPIYFLEESRVKIVGNVHDTPRLLEGRDPSGG